MIPQNYKELMQCVTKRLIAAIDGKEDARLLINLLSYIHSQKEEGIIK